MRVGFIGFGIVGSATAISLRGHDICVFDKYISAEEKEEKFRKIGGHTSNMKFTSVDSVSDVYRQSEIIFICLPTPMDRDGTINIDVIKSAIEQMADCYLNTSEDKIIVIKSTAVSGTTKRLETLFYSRIGMENRNINIGFAFNPEFLVEATYIQDALNPDRIIIGTDSMWVYEKLEKMYLDSGYKNIPIVATSSSSAEMVKYISNTFLFTKVIFANMAYDLCGACGVDYEKIKQMLLMDKRIGKSHWQVPGPDGDRGGGGKCFIKDTSALISMGNRIGVDVSLLEKVMKQNLVYRTKIDWECRYSDKERL
jgi:UDPglucose 6-dehydrogenase